MAHRHPRALPSPPAPVPGQWGSELHRECVEQHLKSVEWRSLPSVGTSSSGGTDSDPGSGWLAEPHRVQKVTGQPPCAAGRSSELTKPHRRSFGREMQALPEGGVRRVSLVAPPSPHREAGISAPNPKQPSPAAWSPQQLSARPLGGLSCLIPRGVGGLG